MRFSQGGWEIFKLFRRSSEPSYAHAAMDNLVQENGIHLAETTK